MTDHILSQRKDGILTVTIKRPEKLNAFTNDMYRTFGEVFLDASDDPSLRCILVQASGDRAFCVGSDIAEFNATLGQPDRQIAETRIGRQAMDAMDACPHPIIGALQGACIGGGLEIATLCDLRIATDTARFGIPIKGLNMHAEIEDLAAMDRTLGASLCLDLLLTGRMMEASEAHDRGFVHRVCAADHLNELVDEMAQTVASGAPLAARWHKKALRALHQPSADLYQLTNEALACYHHNDFAEGCAAFAEKRAPNFTGT